MIAVNTFEMEKFKRAGSSAFRIASDLAITQTPLVNNVLDILSQHPEIIVNAIKHIDNATLTDLLRNIIGAFYNLTSVRTLSLMKQLFIFLQIFFLTSKMLTNKKLLQLY